MNKLKSKVIKCPCCKGDIKIDVIRTKKRIGIDEIKKGGVFKLSLQDLELIEGEKMQIDNIIYLCRYDETIKDYMLYQVVSNFFVDLERHFADWFASNGLLREQHG
jgi:predicted DNA-binding antitoxin AbrB/MazE fold protein